MQSRSNKIQTEIDNLINTINKNASESIRQQIQSYSRKILSSFVGRPNTDTIADVREKVINRISNSSDQRTVIMTQDLTQRFANNSSIYRKTEVLRMLLKLSQLNQNNKEGLSNVFREVKKGKELNITTADSTANFSVIHNPSQKRAGQMEQLKIIRNKGSVEDGVTESDLIRQLLFVFNNTNSSDIIQIQGSFKVKGSLKVSDTVRQMAAELSEMGWLHKKIMSSSTRPGAVRKALKLALQIQLNEYYRWIGVMQSLAKQNRLNLRRLQRWSFNPLMNMKWLAIILDAVEPFDGCHIISIVNSYRPNGIIAINSLLNRLISHLMQPLLHYIHNWVYLGQLLDQSGQFFIQQNKKVSQSQEWSDRFKLVYENVPNILDREAAEMIFISGKSIYFLRNRCKITYSVKTPFLQAKNIISVSDNPSNSLISSAFISWLRTVHSQVNEALVSTLFTRFHLKFHLQSMKHFFLLGKGDFIQHLYDSLKDKLSLKKHEISQHSLDGYISDAVIRCFTDFKLPDKVSSYRTHVVDRLLAKKIDYGGGSEGWDVFNLTYSLQRIEPLQTILSPQIMMNYQKIFYFLWRIKQIQQNLKNIWVLHSKDQSTKLRLEQASSIKQIFHASYMLRYMMSHFLTNLHSYLMITMEASWKKFNQDLQQSKSFDQILKVHRQFQQQILQITLNTPKGKQISSALNNIFSVIANFKTVSMKLQQNFDQYFEKMRLYKQRQGMIRKKLIEVDSLEVPQFSSGKLFSQIDELKSCFSTSFKNFFNQIRKQGETKLNVLSFKLDYSEYYTNQYAE